MNTEELKKDLEKSSRPDLNLRATEEFGIENSADFPNAGSLIEAILEKENTPKEKPSSQDSKESTMSETPKENQKKEKVSEEEKKQKADEQKAEKLLEERGKEMDRLGMVHGDKMDWEGFGLSINADDLVEMDDDSFTKWLTEIKEAKSNLEKGEGTVSTKYPSYKSVKKVQAVKIGTVTRNSKGGALVTPENEEFEPFMIDRHFLHKFNPRGGGYYKIYSNGVKSYESAETFEAGYEKE